ncbi:MAG: GNAT family N-acetyltransferase [Chloroflexi bacterium]|nr:GNAT family N-acetyltransferase [Chloroflexota bacterium]
MTQIERAAVKDVLTIKDVLSETWHDTYASLLPDSAIETITSQWHAPKLLAEQMQNPDIYFAIARDEGEIAGVITARKQEDVIFVGRLYVRPQCQRRGIGTQLLEASYRAFPAVQRARLTVEAQNLKGVAFYRKQGFRETARMFEEVAGARLENVVMERSL